MKSRFGEKAEIKVGQVGQFDVVVDGHTIFSKHEAGRFPADGEVEERFATLKAGGPLPAPEAARPGPLRRLAQKLFG